MYLANGLSDVVAGIDVDCGAEVLDNSVKHFFALLSPSVSAHFLLDELTDFLLNLPALRLLQAVLDLNCLTDCLLAA